MQFRRTPLAWRSITHDKKRFVLALTGIMFATILMFMQLGFLNALFDSQLVLIQLLNADLIITNRLKQRLGSIEPFGRRRLEQARQIASVTAVYPLYIEGITGVWRNPLTGRSRAIRVIGMDPDDPVFLIPGFDRLAAELRKEDTALLDEKSKDVFGPRQLGLQTELSGHRVQVAGTFVLGTDFDFDGTVVVSEHTYLKIFPAERTSGSRLGRVEMGLVRVTPGVPAALVKRQLEEALTPDVRIWTPTELMAQEIGFWQREAPVGFIFGMGLAIGFLVGIVICSQILYNSVLDRMALFGTLKAIGYTNGYLVKLVASEALWLSILAFLPGLLFSQALYGILASLIGFAMFLTPARIGLILSMTLGMSLIAAMVALRKALTADPAEVFK